MTIFDIFIWILIGLLAVAVGSYGLVIYWQRQTFTELKDLFSQFRQFKIKIDRVKDSVRGYSTSDPEPFGSLTGRLAKQLTVSEAKSLDLLKRYSDIQSHIRLLSAAGWLRIVQMPFDWYKVQKSVFELKTDFENAESGLNQVEILSRELDKLSWKVAGIARQVLSTDDTASQILNDLYSKGIQGTTLEQNINGVNHWRDTLHGQVPAYFFTGNEEMVTAQSDKNTIAKVFRIVEEARVSVEPLLKQAQEWEKQRSALEKVLTDIAERFRQLSGQFEELEANPVHPVTWDASRGELYDLRQQIERLGTIKKSRTVEQLEIDFSAAGKISDRLASLAAHTQQVRQDHQELLTLLATADIQQGPEFTRQAQKLANQVENYAAENFPVAHGVNRLRQEIRLLTDSHQRLAWQDPKEPVKETELPESVTEARNLSKLHQDIRPRVTGIQARLSEIQASERSGRDELNRIKALLNQVIALSGSNPALSGAASEFEQYRQNVDPLLAELERSRQGNLDQKVERVRALVQRADQAGSRWLGQLLDELNNKKKILSQKLDVLLEIAMLEDPAVLETQDLLEHKAGSKQPDASVIAAQVSGPTSGAAVERIKSFIPFGKGKSNGGSTGETKNLAGVTLVQAVPLMKQLNEEWQRCVSATHALEEIERPLLERHQQAEQQRGNARQLLSRAQELIPASRTWPPTGQILGGERGQMDALEKQWDNLRQTPIKAINLVSKLGQLSESYQSLAGRIKQVVERAEQEQHKIAELQAHYEESKDIWGELRDINPDNAVLRSEVNILLQETDQDLAELKQRYKQEGLPYNQVLQNLRGIIQKLDNAQVEIGDGRLVDINGEVVVEQ